MQSTEEYLDQLLASVSDEAGEGQSIQQNTAKKHHKSIEELDESELTEEVLQKQLALLLGLETEQDEDEFEEDDFIAQYAEQVSEPVISESIVESIPEPEPAPEPEVAEPVPEISSTGVLSADEIEALFASMGVEEEEPSLGDAIVEEMLEGFSDETEEMLEEIPDEIEEVAEVTEETEVPVATPQISDSGVLSPDEIAALFASMGTEDAEETEDAVETEDVVEVVEEEDTGALTREELEELGLGDIADVLGSDLYDTMADDLEEISHPHDMNLQEVELTEDSTKVEPQEEKQIIEIPDFENNEEILLDIENVDAMLEATAKLAEEESFGDVETQVEDDILSMLAQFEEESVMESMAAQEESAKAAEEAVNMALEEETSGVPEELLAEETEGKKKKKPKKEKVKKEKVKKEKPVKEKKAKVSLKDRIAAFMFEDESLDDGETEAVDAEGTEADDLLEAKPAKAKKEKKSKKDKKAKKSKDDKMQDENAAIAAELAEEDKKKAKKKEKPPKEKKAKKVVFADATEAEEEKKKTKGAIGTRGIVATLLVCASILGLILVGTYFLPKQLSLAAARVAFYAQNYEETAMRLKGQELNDSDRIIYEKANLLYGLEERYHQYEIYMQRGMSKEALDALFRGVAACNEEEILAGQLGIETEWKLAKDAFINALQEQFNVDAQTAETIASLRNPDYTVAVENILAGRLYNDMSSYGGEAPVKPEETTEAESEADTEAPEENLEDLLPEEEEILQQMQQANEENLPEESETSENNENDVLFSGSVEGGAVNFVE